MSTATPELDLRFPIGKFDITNYSSRSENLKTIVELPMKLRTAVEGLSDEQLETRYRPDGWTLRQTAHHIADSHMNLMIRFKLALTEDEAPTIRPYCEDRWAELADSKLSIEASLGIIDGVHARWAELMRNMSESDFAREFVHPETGSWTLEKALSLYAWHSLHHTAHITGTRERNGW